MIEVDSNMEELCLKDRKSGRELKFASGKEKEY
jgi:hypothetical protein